MPLSSSLYAKQTQREHSETRQLLVKADEALHQLELAKDRLQRATTLYRERYEGRRDSRRSERG